MKFRVYYQPSFQSFEVNAPCLWMCSIIEGIKRRRRGWERKLCWSERLEETK